MEKYGLWELRKSFGYRIFSYATYFWLLLFLLNIHIYKGGSNAILGIFIYLILTFIIFPTIGISFVLYARVNISNKALEHSNKTNIIHDIGAIMYFILLMKLFIAITCNNIMVYY